MHILVYIDTTLMYVYIEKNSKEARLYSIRNILLFLVPNEINITV